MGDTPRVCSPDVTRASLARTFNGDAALPHLAHQRLVEKHEGRIDNVSINIPEHPAATGEIKRETVGVSSRLADFGSGWIEHVFTAEVGKKRADLIGENN